MCGGRHSALTLLGEVGWVLSAVGAAEVSRSLQGVTKWLLFREVYKAEQMYYFLEKFSNN